ncbi:MAG: isoleucine--tRNA ligase [Acidimicrobiaceae bacterium]|nr:isoleucine--tRNA ligase [Acidimicrobiaceae bacterium]
MTIRRNESTTDGGGVHSYPKPRPQLNLPQIEETILNYWEIDSTFEASVAKNPTGETEFVFYDGPPFANGLPHYGHLLTGFVKDAIPRYQTMRGRRVERRFGWDCHGLPAEMATEKELGVNGRIEVEQFGIGKFNDHCRSLVQRTTDEWHRYVNRQARWVDFTNDYKTMDSPFMESVIWAFKELYRKGLAYEGYRVLPYCWECETPLSNFETRQDNSYRSRVDPAVTVEFTLDPDPSCNVPELRGSPRLLAWTTTPWTLPANLAVAVGPDIDYAAVKIDGKILVLAESRMEHYGTELDGGQVVARFKGTELVGRTFTPIFDYFNDLAGAFRVIAGDFVATDEGTGIVQMAPGFGEEDQQACEAAGIPLVCPVDDRARYTTEMGDIAGIQVFEANPYLIKKLAERGVLFQQADYDHSYPHCWRTDTPLIYKAVSSWFVKVTALKERLLEKNEEINWVPSHIQDGAFGKWLEGARDWSITRNRYWGTPIPVWKSDDPAYPRIDVYGSLAELAADFGSAPTDLHRPAIDELVRPNPDDPTGKSMMRRVPDIMDCWFESGSMPYAQLHYPFENREQFEQHFPADFIVEYIGQTRGWFYTLHVLSVAIFDKPPFKHCMAHGVLLGSDGSKLSKRLQNYPDPWAVFEEIGADAMRWFLLSSSVLRGQEMVLDRAAIVDVQRRVINPIWNAFYFLSLYAEIDGIVGTERYDQSGLLDRYILAKTEELIRSTTEAMDNFDLTSATSKIEAFLDALNNWYIRRSRERFWRENPKDGTTDQDKSDAYDTLHTVLTILTRLTAPLLPMLSEEIYRSLTGERSVHLSDWPTVKSLTSDMALVTEMDMVREVCSLAHSIRKANGLRARLPLRKVVVASPDSEALSSYKELIKSELNIKEVELLDDPSSLSTVVISVVPSKIGPRLGKAVQQVIAAAKQGNFRLLEDQRAEVGGHLLEADEFEVQTRAADESSTRVLPSRQGIVFLDTAIDDELELEGLARDVVRDIQRSRKEADFSVSDRVYVNLEIGDGVDSKLGQAVLKHLESIAHQVLAIELKVNSGPIAEPERSEAFNINDTEVRLTIRR